MAKKENKKNWFVEQLKNNTFAIIFWTSTVGFSVFNLYLISQLAPIVKSIDQLTPRVQANEEYRKNSEKTYERFIVVEQKVSQIQEDVKDIKNYLLKP